MLGVTAKVAMEVVSNSSGLKSFQYGHIPSVEKWRLLWCGLGRIQTDRVGTLWVGIRASGVRNRIEYKDERLDKCILESPVSPIIRRD